MVILGYKPSIIIFPEKVKGRKLAFLFLLLFQTWHYERNSNDTILIRRLEHLVIDENKTLTQIIQEALDEYLEKGVIRVENKKKYDFKSKM
jgi:hypothetical protein